MSQCLELCRSVSSPTSRDQRKFQKRTVEVPSWKDDRGIPFKVTVQKHGNEKDIP